MCVCVQVCVCVHAEHDHRDGVGEEDERICSRLYLRMRERSEMHKERE